MDLKAYAASKMIPVNDSPVTLVLEGAHVGRGKKWSEDMQGFIKEQDILTLGVKVWHVLEYDHYQVPESCYGQFHRGDTYVVRWQYMITNAGKLWLLTVSNLSILLSLMVWRAQID